MLSNWSHMSSKNVTEFHFENFNNQFPLFLSFEEMMKHNGEHAPV